MMFGLGYIFYFALFMVNGIAVLSEDRFLNRIGWGTQRNQFQSSYEQEDVKTKIINLINAIRTVLRVPLIAINIVVIVYELVLG
ncbi:protein transport protein Yos1p [Diutina catenulata]